MRLIHIEDDGAFTLVEHYDGDVPPYAILSHTWGADQDEITYLDMMNGTSREKRGYRKLEFCRKESLQRRLRYFWIDTCCIDKSSSAELTEAINSMFRWYKESKICLVYLSDVLTSDIAELRSSRWFTRGWTLQELIAPRLVEFYSSSGQYLGSKQTLQLTLHAITGIAMPALDSAHVSQFDVEEHLIVGIGASRFKIIVSSRPLLDMETVLGRQHHDRGVVHRILLQDENHSTICTIVEHGIKALRKAVRSHSDDTGRVPSVSRQIHFQRKQSQKKDEFLARIQAYLLNHANGVVLWVVAVLNLMESAARKAMHTFADLEAKLKRLPVELSGLYRYHVEDLQRRSDAEELLKVRKALMFISGANSMRRRLTLGELWDALAIPSGLEEALKSNQDPIELGRIHIASWREFWWKLYDLCGPLVEVVSLSEGATCPVYGDEDIDAKDHVQLSHRTVQDFLADRETAGILAFDDTEAASLIQQTLQDYATVVMPPDETQYCAFTPKEGSDWRHSLEDLAEYLDDKRLLPW
ncbi:hypothetical protein E8E13_009212 [Curvularia kusanoi]|uniref:Heterokaryon incompatibility domain-containing protein n=1 Tax=Curvularia kusanoi TaxID=90978 RepID=A0A9P4TCE5_CURKU|nr:hypothetical protein E8E13_009212 [Curvularia kusanoi]